MSSKTSLQQKRLIAVLISIFFYVFTIIFLLVFLHIAYKSKRGEYLVVDRPDFSLIENVQQKKQVFFHYIYTLAEFENKHILKKRKRLLELSEKFILNNRLRRSDIKFIRQLADAYDIEQKESLDGLISGLKLRVNVVPLALVQAQAAIESGWGTSRFAVNGHNLFGQWCFKKGCGIVPANRAQGKTHEVAVFESDAIAIRFYLRNLNTFHAYEHFRELRSSMEVEGLAYSTQAAIELADALVSYSERGEHYVKEVQAMIRHNKL